MERRIIMPIRILTRATIAISSILVMSIATAYHAAMSTFYKLRSFTALLNSYERKRDTALAWEYIKAAAMDINFAPILFPIFMFLDPTMRNNQAYLLGARTWCFERNSKAISYNLSFSEVRIDQSEIDHGKLLENNHYRMQIRNSAAASEIVLRLTAANLASRQFLGLYVYNFFVRKAYPFYALADAQLNVSTFNGQSFLNISYNDVSTLQFAHSYFFLNYIDVNNIATILPSNSSKQKAEFTSPAYPWPNLNRIKTLIISIALAVFSIWSLKSQYYAIRASTDHGILATLNSYLFSVPLIALTYYYWNKTRKLTHLQNGSVELARAKHLLQEKNFDEAMHWFGEAAKKGVPEAHRMYGIAKMLSNNHNCADLNNLNEGLFWLSQAAKQGDEIALRELNGLILTRFNDVEIIEILGKAYVDPLKYLLFKHQNEVTSEEGKTFFINLIKLLSAHESPETMAHFSDLHKIFYEEERSPLFKHVDGTEYFPSDISNLIVSYIITTEDPRQVQTASQILNEELFT